MGASSQDLHPTTGARFVFERVFDQVFDQVPDQIGDAYAVVIYLPAGLRWSGHLAWIDGVATLEPDPPDQPKAPPPDEASLTWAREEALKLARTLRRTPKQRMIRWRG